MSSPKYFNLFLRFPGVRKAAEPSHDDDESWAQWDEYGAEWDESDEWGEWDESWCPGTATEPTAPNMDHESVDPNSLDGEPLESDPEPEDPSTKPFIIDPETGYLL